MNAGMGGRDVSYLSNRYWRDCSLVAALQRRWRNCLATTSLMTLKLLAEPDLPVAAAFVPGHMFVA